ncbi:MAG: sodium:proline symporter, partial [Acidobacteria bacterium]|nr:sodium:proline symporter [Acidobacteriota bacterium]
ATWYPGAEPGGCGYVAQRIFCAKDEKHSLWATMWFNVAHYALRPWPWILTALASVILYPDLADKEVGFIRMMTDHMPLALRGLMLAAFLAAYMSTIATHLNWGASYFINDFYRRFLVQKGSEGHYVTVSRLATAVLMIIGGAVSFYLENVQGAWKILINIGAGTGAVYLLRWYWWRINAWSEIAAMSTAAVVSISLQIGVRIKGFSIQQFGVNFKGFSFQLDPNKNLDFAHMMLITVIITTLVWLVVTFLTKPVPQEKLLEFYRRVRPTAAGWRPIAGQAPEVPPDREGWHNLKYWVLGCAMVYLRMFAIGKLLLGEPALAGLLALGAVVSGFWLYRDFSRRGWEHFGGS